MGSYLLHIFSQMKEGKGWEGMRELETGREVEEEMNNTVFTLLFLCFALILLMSDTIWEYST